MSILSVQQQRKNEIKGLMAKSEMKDRFIALLGGEKQYEAFKANLFNIALDDNLSDCSVYSIVKCALNIASLKLTINKHLGKAYIVPRGKKVDGQWIKEACVDIGYKGWLDIAKRNNLSVKAFLVYKCDTFEMDFLDEKNTIFKPNFDLRNESDTKWVEENLKGAFVRVTDLKSGEISDRFIQTGTLIKIMQHNDSVKRGSYSAYSEWLSEMLTAKAIKYTLSKTAMTEEISEAVALDNENEQDFSETKSKVNITKGENKSLFNDLLQDNNMIVIESDKEGEVTNENGEVVIGEVSNEQ